MVALAALLLPGCPDTTLPSPQRPEILYPGPTDGPVCDDADLRPEDPSALVVHFIDVGQGDAIWLRLPTGDPENPLELLIDAGMEPSQGGNDGARIVADYLDANGLPPGEAIDWLVITHGDLDHYGGAEGLLERYTIRNFADSAYVSTGNRWPLVRSKIIEEVESRGGRVASPAIPELAADPGEESPLLQTPFARVRVLWGVPNAPGPQERLANNGAVVLQVEAHGRRLLLTADIEAPAENALVGLHDLGTLSLQSEILKVPHHGSESSSTQAFLDRVFGGVPEAQRYAVVLSGRRSFGGLTLPRSTVLDRLGAMLPPGHLRSTAHADEDRRHPEESGDDHLVLVIAPAEPIRLCARVDGGYTPPPEEDARGSEEEDTRALEDDEDPEE